MPQGHTANSSGTFLGTAALPGHLPPSLPQHSPWWGALRSGESWPQLWAESPPCTLISSSAGCWSVV